MYHWYDVLQSYCISAHKIQKGFSAGDMIPGHAKSLPNPSPCPLPGSPTGAIENAGRTKKSHSLKTKAGVIRYII